MTASWCVRVVTATSHPIIMPWSNMVSNYYSITKTGQMQSISLPCNGKFPTKDAALQLTSSLHHPDIYTINNSSSMGRKYELHFKFRSLFLFNRWTSVIITSLPWHVRVLVPAECQVWCNSFISDRMSMKQYCLIHITKINMPFAENWRWPRCIHTL